ncbi:MAG TPA: DUF429 domain-containing protein [Candidatus Binatia bacterium]|nr:DUF429 domain-containing protein [Candidatus Binatia bacterium]
MSADADLRIIAIDWSGARTGARRKIWAAEAGPHELVHLWHGLDRDAVGDLLVDRAGHDPSLVVGIDFAFSLPRAFLVARGIACAPDLWARAAVEGEAWLARCEPPFWGRRGTRRPGPAAGGLRRTEEEVARACGTRPKSAFQIGGAGAVGTGSIRGMPLLARLRAAGFSIWPFDAPRLPLVVEIYPRALYRRAVNKSDPRARLAAFDAAAARATPDARACVARSDDAFDAAVAAVVMARHAAELRALPATADAERRLEGIIWTPLRTRAGRCARRS